MSNSSRHNGINRNNLIELKPKKQDSSCGKWITFSLINARSVRNKSIQICDYIVENNFDFTAITETWLSDSDEKDIISAVTPTGYSFYNNPRGNGRGGGTGLIIKSNIKAKPATSTKYNTFELQQIFISINNATYRLCIIYRPPPNQKNGFTFKEFYLEFCEYITNIAALPESLLILGDFNIDFNPNVNYANELKELLDINGLTQKVNFPTHISGNCLDWLITRKCDVNFDSPFADFPCISDHHTVSCRLFMPKPNPIKLKVRSRNIKNINSNSLAKDIAEIDLPLTSVEDAVSCYNDKLESILDDHAPLFEKTIIVRPNTSWYNAQTRELKVQKRRLERKWKKSKSENDWIKYREHCKLLTACLNACKKDFLSCKILESENDKKKLFSIAKTLLSGPKGTTLPDISDDTSLASSFNSYFIDKIVKIRDNITNSSTVETLSIVKDKLFPKEADSQMSKFRTASEDEIRKIIRSASSSTCSLDPLPTGLLKDNLDALVPVITAIVNKSLEDGTFPSNLKHANIIPLIKKDNLDKENFKNYRPVSNLPFISKIIEKVVAARLKGHLSSNHLWEKTQSAYRECHSTETALLRVHSDITKAISLKKNVALILLDLSAAFDTIDHKILLTRLSSRFGITGSCLKWFESYLNKRTQSVTINTSSSDRLELNFGVPQGSVLGPLLFTLYVAPISDITNTHGLDNMFYADDSQLYVSLSSNDNSALISLEKCITEIKAWMKTNLLKLNDSKTEVILCGSKHHLKNHGQISIKVGECSISSVSSVRNLGAFFDETMSMDDFVKKKAIAIHLQLRKIQRIRKFLSIDACKSLVQALVISRLDYCCSLLLGTKKKNIQHLQRLQNAAARLVYQAHPRDSASALLIDLHWLPVNERILFRNLTYVHKCLHNNAPTYLSELLHPHEPSRTLRPRGTNKLKEHYLRSSISGQSFELAIPHEWNKLPEHIRSSTSCSNFKKLLKTHLFKFAYNL